MYQMAFIHLFLHELFIRGGENYVLGFFHFYICAAPPSTNNSTPVM